MSQRLPQDGVELVVRGLDKFTKDLATADKKWDESIKRWRDAGTGRIVAGGASGATGGAGGGIGAIGTALSGLGTAGIAGLAAAAAGIGAVIIAAKAAGKAISSAAQGMASFGKESILTAARSRELGAVLDLLGSRAGWSQEQIDQNVTAMMDLGIRTDVAQSLLSQFARYQLDAADATGIARVAQDAAVLSMKDSSDALDNIMHGIMTQNTMVLRNAGLNVSASKAMDTYAASIGSTADSLSETERIQAMMNAVMEEGTRIAGAYETAMEEPAKRIRSLNRHFYEIQRTIGDLFMPAFGNIVTIIEKVVKWFRTAVSEGGFLRSTLVFVGAVADILTGKLASMADGALQAGEQLYTGLVRNLAKAAEDALRWGVELVVAFAEGVVIAASTALIKAMQFIGDIMEKWLLGASPPKIAPGIESWGIKTMERYLRGMTQADFGILEQIQRPLQAILGDAQFADVSKALAQAMAAGDRAAVIDLAGRGAGVFADNLRTLAGLHIDYAQAVEDAAQAETRLQQIRERLTDSGEKVARLTREYNNLLREGADAATLAAKMEEIRAAEINRADLAGQVEDQERLVETSKERTAALDDQVKREQSILAQLLAMNDALKEDETLERDATEKASKAAAAATTPMLAGIGTGFGRTLDKAIDEMKDKIREKFKDIFAPLITAWEDVKENLGTLGEKWDEFKKRIGGVWEQLKEDYPALANVEDWITNLPEKVTELADTLTTKLADAFAHVKEILVGESGTGGLYGEWLKVYDWLEKTWNVFVKDPLTNILDTFRTAVLSPLEKGFQSAADAVSTFWENVKKLTDPGFVSKVMKWIDILNPFFSYSPSPFEKGLMGINREMDTFRAKTFPMLVAASAFTPAVGQGMMSGGSTTNQINMPIGPVSISNQLEADRFETRVERAVLRALKGGRV